jgi:hypothetical protein
VLEGLARGPIVPPDPKARAKQNTVAPPVARLCMARAELCNLPEIGARGRSLTEHVFAPAHRASVRPKPARVAPPRRDCGQRLCRHRHRRAGAPALDNIVRAQPAAERVAQRDLLERGSGPAPPAPPAPVELLAAAELPWPDGSLSQWSVMRAVAAMIAPRPILREWGGRMKKDLRADLLMTASQSQNAMHEPTKQRRLAHWSL